MKNVGLIAALSLILWSTPAIAVTSLAYVSATGNDSEPCSVQATPCKTLQRAISVTRAGGTIRLLSNLPGQTAIVARALTIDGGGNTMLGSIVINNASAVVTVRNLYLTGRGTVGRGISIINAAVVSIENSTTERYIDSGIRLYANVSTDLYVSDSVSRDNGSGLYMDGPSAAFLTVDHSRFQNNTGSGMVIRGGNATVTGSEASGNFIGVSIVGGKGSFIETATIGNESFGFSNSGTGDMTLDSCLARGNADTGLFNSSEARVSNSVFTENDRGVHNNTEGTLRTFQNNLIVGNFTNVVGTLTPAAAQ